MWHELPDIALALIVLFAFLLAWRTEGTDPIWQERRRAISPAARSRIAAAARSGGLLADSGVLIVFGMLPECAMMLSWISSF
jgi:hypothetical protein